MRKFLLSTLFLFLSSVGYAGDLGASIPFPPLDTNTPIPTPVIEKQNLFYSTFDSCCKVSCPGGWASGTAIKGAPKGKTYVLTARHVTDLNTNDIKVWCCDKVYAARLAAKHSVKDVAIVEVDADLPALELAKSEPAKGTKFNLKACGVQFDFTVPREGIVNYYGVWSGAGTNGRAMYCTITAGPGDSGGGLIDEDGNLIGSVSGAGPDSTMAAQPLDSIKEVLTALINARSSKPQVQPQPPITQLRQSQTQLQFPMQCIGRS